MMSIGTGQMNMLQSAMQSMLTAQSALDKAQIQGSAANQFEGRANVLKSEIKSGNGNIEAKEEELAEVTETVQDVASSQFGTLSEAIGELSKDVESAHYDTVDVNASVSEAEADGSAKAKEDEDGKTEVLPENTGDRIYNSTGEIMAQTTKTETQAVSALA